MSATPPGREREVIEPVEPKRDTFDTEFRIIDTLILCSLRREPAHGYALDAYITNFTFARIHLGSASIYRTLKRMSKERLIKALPKRPGERAQYYDITQMGLNQLGRDLSLLRRVIKAFDGQL